jgi:hypothetical protein
MGQNMWGYRCALVIIASLALATPLRAEDDAAFESSASAIESKSHTPSDSERRIEAALDMPLRAPLEFVETPLNQITQVLAEDYKIPIQFDSSALDAVASSPEVEVTFNIANVSLRSALDLMLLNAGTEDLTYIIDNEVLLITTHEEAEKRLETRVYRVDDLVVDDQSDASWGYDADFDQLIDVIVATVDHESWMENGTGEGEIQPFAPGMLVVTQTRLTHSRVAALLESLRETKREINADSTGDRQEASRRPVTRSIKLDDEVIASCAQVRETVRNALLNSVDWSRDVEGAEADELFLQVLPNRILVRHAPQVVRQVERMVQVVSPPSPVKGSGNFCGGRTRRPVADKAEQSPDLADPPSGGEDGEQKPARGGGRGGF